ncbi:MAG: type I-D CRISPR-associated protein Csc2, partial [SAR324 cluster bacterium]|nr:type I-D CRISPR-associated protein Csc2 [SAR324 cluster bacterium]
FILPGTLMVQVLSTRGRLLPPEGLDHLMLSVGLAGAYGGQTSVTGTNIRTHLVGIFADKFEKAVSSPYELVKLLSTQSEEFRKNPDQVIPLLHQLMSNAHESSISTQECQTYLNSLLERFESNELRSQYEQAARKVGELFDLWFVGKTKAGKAATAQPELNIE